MLSGDAMFFTAVQGLSWSLLEAVMAGMGQVGTGCLRLGACMAAWFPFSLVREGVRWSVAGPLELGQPGCKGKKGSFDKSTA